MKSGKNISFITAVGMSINIMIGAGIYAGTDIISAISGNAGFLVWCIVAAVYFPTVYCVAQLAALLPNSNGIVQYVQHTFGNKVGFLTSCLYYFCYLSSAACVLKALQDMFLTKLAGNIFVEQTILFLPTILLISILLNLVRLSLVGRIQFGMTLAKLTPIFIVILITPFFIGKGFLISASELQASFMPSALAPAIFGFMGFEFACNIVNHIEGGAKRAAQSIIAGFVLTTAICMGFHFGLLQIMGVENLIRHQAYGFPLFVGIPALIGILSATIGITLFLSFLNSTNGILTLVSSILQSLAANNTIKASHIISKLNRNDRPWVAVIVSAVAMLLLCIAIPNKKHLMSLCALAFVISLIFTVGSFFIIQKRLRNYTGMAIATVSLLINITLAYTQFIGSGSSLTEQLFTVSPIPIILGLGLLMMKRNQHIATASHTDNFERFTPSQEKNDQINPN